jgi:SAM-dependent methyltransferase
VYAEEDGDADGVDWDALPPGADPFGTNKKGGEARGMRKRNQVMTFVRHLRALRGRRKIKRCVDFGCGTGNVLMTCAATFPDVEFVGVDLNATSIEILNSRIRKSGLTNVSAVVGLIEDGDTLEADCVLALHVCGSATDRVLNNAVRARIPFVIAPCCVGKVQEGGMRSLNRMRNDLISFDQIEDIERPRSRLMRAAGFDFETYMSAATLADWSGHQGVDPSDPNEPLAALPRRAKSAIEADRGEFAREHAYDVTLHKMPAQSGIRDDVLVGIPI